MKWTLTLLRKIFIRQTSRGKVREVACRSKQKRHFRYFYQLTRGCGRVGCVNPYCASGECMQTWQSNSYINFQDRIKHWNPIKLRHWAWNSRSVKIIFAPLPQIRVHHPKVFWRGQMWAIAYAFFQSIRPHHTSPLRAWGRWYPPPNQQMNTHPLYACSDQYFQHLIIWIWVSWRFPNFLSM